MENMQRWPTNGKESSQRASLPTPLLSISRISGTTSPPTLSFESPIITPSSFDSGSGSGSGSGIGEAVIDTARKLALSPCFFKPILIEDQTRRVEATKELLFALQADESLLRAHIKSLVRLAKSCPYPDIAESFMTLLKSKPTLEIPEMTRASMFISNSLIPAANTADSTLSSLFKDVFLRTGRVGNLNRILALHPSYYAQHAKTMNTLLRMDGPLPIQYRCYIALLASAQYDCKYLVELMENEFKLRNGDEKWLQGLEFAPMKIQNLMPLLMTLAHCPWTLNKDLIKQLCGGVGSNVWTIGELVSAIVLACTFLALSGVAFGTGVIEELDLSDNFQLSLSKTTNQKPSQSADETVHSSSPPQFLISGANVEQTTELMNRLKIQASNQEEESEAASANQTTKTTKTKDKKKKQQQQQQQQQIDENERESIPIEKSPNIGVQQQELKGPSLPELAKYRRANGQQILYQDYKEHGNNKFIFQEFSWNEHGYELVNRFFSDAASLLDELFKLTYELTYHTLSGSDGITTDPFRQAIWYYVQRIHGVFHEDYEYHQQNEYLQIHGDYRLKNYIKLVSCTPYLITKDSFELGFNLRPDEKVHVCLLATESHKQVGILYGLRAVMNHMDES